MRGYDLKGSRIPLASYCPLSAQKMNRSPLLIHCERPEAASDASAWHAVAAARDESWCANRAASAGRPNKQVRSTNTLAASTKAGFDQPATASRRSSSCAAVIAFAETSVTTDSPSENKMADFVASSMSLGSKARTGAV